MFLQFSTILLISTMSDAATTTPKPGTSKYKKAGKSKILIRKIAFDKETFPPFMNFLPEGHVLFGSNPDVPQGLFRPNPFGIETRKTRIRGGQPQASGLKIKMNRRRNFMNGRQRNLMNQLWSSKLSNPMSWMWHSTLWPGFEDNYDTLNQFLKDLTNERSNSGQSGPEVGEISPISLISGMQGYSRDDSANKEEGLIDSRISVPTEKAEQGYDQRVMKSGKRLQIPTKLSRQGKNGKRSSNGGLTLFSRLLNGMKLEGNGNMRKTDMIVDGGRNGVGGNIFDYFVFLDNDNDENRKLNDKDDNDDNNNDGNENRKKVNEDGDKDKENHNNNFINNKNNENDNNSNEDIIIKVEGVMGKVNDKSNFKINGNSNDNNDDDDNDNDNDNKNSKNKVDIEGRIPKYDNNNVYNSMKNKKMRKMMILSLSESQLNNNNKEGNFMKRKNISERNDNNNDDDIIVDESTGRSNKENRIGQRTLGPISSSTIVVESKQEMNKAEPLFSINQDLKPSRNTIQQSDHITEDRFIPETSGNSNDLEITTNPRGATNVKEVVGSGRRNRHVRKMKIRKFNDDDIGDVIDIGNDNDRKVKVNGAPVKSIKQKMLKDNVKSHSWPTTPNRNYVNDNSGNEDFYFDDSRRDIKIDNDINDNNNNDHNDKGELFNGRSDNGRKVEALFRDDAHKSVQTSLKFGLEDGRRSSIKMFPEGDGVLQPYLDFMRGGHNGGGEREVGGIEESSRLNQRERLVSTLKNTGNLVMIHRDDDNDDDNDGDVGSDEKKDDYVVGSGGLLYNGNIDSGRVNIGDDHNSNEDSRNENTDSNIEINNDNRDGSNVVFIKEINNGLRNDDNEKETRNNNDKSVGDENDYNEDKNKNNFIGNSNTNNKDNTNSDDNDNNNGDNIEDKNYHQLHGQLIIDILSNQHTTNPNRLAQKKNNNNIKRNNEESKPFMRNHRLGKDSRGKDGKEVEEEKGRFITKGDEINNEDTSELSERDKETGRRIIPPRSPTTTATTTRKDNINGVTRRNRPRPDYLTEKRDLVTKRPARDDGGNYSTGYDLNASMQQARRRSRLAKSFKSGINKANDIVQDDAYYLDKYDGNGDGENGVNSLKLGKRGGEEREREMKKKTKVKVKEEKEEDEVEEKKGENENEEEGEKEKMKKQEEEEGEKNRKEVESKIRKRSVKFESAKKGLKKDDVTDDKNVDVKMYKLKNNVNVLVEKIKRMKGKVDDEENNDKKKQLLKDVDDKVGTRYFVKDDDMKKMMNINKNNNKKNDKSDNDVSGGRDGNRWLEILTIDTPLKPDSNENKNHTGSPNPHKSDKEHRRHLYHHAAVGLVLTGVLISLVVSVICLASCASTSSAGLQRANSRTALYRPHDLYAYNTTEQTHPQPPRNSAGKFVLDNYAYLG